MRAYIRAMAAALVAVSVLLSGCSQAPQAEMEAAKAALQQASNSGAREYMPDQWTAAEKALNDALAEVARQEKALSFMRNYGQARKLLAEATQKARELMAATEQAKTVLRAEVENLRETAMATIEKARKAIAKAPRTRKELTGLKKELGEAEGSLAGTETQLNAGSLLTARDRLRAAIGQAETIIASLEQRTAAQGKKLK